MAILNREDGKQFVLQPYRELLTYKSFNLLRKEVALLAKSNGNFVRLFKRPGNQYEAVFSRDAGYLLGETVWQHFNRVNDLIFCEALPDKKNTLLLVVRDGNVLIDAKIALQHLHDELSSLYATKTKFAVYVYGHIPALERATANKTGFSFNEDHVKSFTKLNESIFDKLKIDPSIQLLSLEAALKEHQSGSSAMAVTAIVIFAVILGGVLFGQHQAKKTEQKRALVDVYQQFKEALSTPAPTQQIAALANSVNVLYSMPGWVATKVDYNDSLTNFEVHSLGGTLERLLAWAKQHNAQVDLTSQGAQVHIPVKLSSRPKPQTITNDKQVTAWIIDQMIRLLPGKSVKINSVSSTSGIKETQLTINFSNASPDVLLLIGETLTGLPVKFNGSSANINNGLLSGSIKLTVLGS